MYLVPERPLSLGERLERLRPRKTVITIGTRNTRTVDFITTRGKHGDVKVIKPAEVPTSDSRL